MKYFMDFEATQFEQEIISVGCVDEDGREFYSLVKPHSMRKMTGFITELTGITSAELRRSPDADEVFSRLYDFIDKSERAQFYCYGNCDGRFISVSLRYVKTFKAQCMLGLIYGSMTDISPELSVIFKTNQTISLYKLADYYGATEERSHHALNDAKLLKHVYEHSRGEDLAECPFPEYVRPYKADRIPVSPPEQVTNPRVIAHLGSEIRPFSSYGKAAEWIMSELLPKGAEISSGTKSNISNRIVLAVANGNKYHGYTWTAPAKK
jgi:inhibitor of KinA sporulation pathway (predicted exonuclease)